MVDKERLIEEACGFYCQYLRTTRVDRGNARVDGVPAGWRVTLPVVGEAYRQVIVTYERLVGEGYGPLEIGINSSDGYKRIWPE